MKFFAEISRESADPLYASVFLTKDVRLPAEPSAEREARTPRSEAEYSSIFDFRRNFTGIG